MTKKGKWTETETQFVMENYLPKGVKMCSIELGRSINAVYQKAAFLGIIKEPRYTNEELENIQNNYTARGPLALSMEMDRSKSAIRDMAVRLGLVTGIDAIKARARINRSRWTVESLRSQSISMKKYRGPMSPSWKGGICNLSEIVRGRLYSAWTKYVFQRDGYTCHLCGIVGGKLVVHHTRTFAEIRDAVIKQHPELNIAEYNDIDYLATLVIEAHELSDGLTLCRSCHKKHHLE